MRKFWETQRNGKANSAVKNFPSSNRPKTKDAHPAVGRAPIIESLATKPRAKSQQPKAPYRPKYAAFFAVNSFHFSGRSSSAKMADTGHTGTHAPQSIHSTGSIYRSSAVS